MSLSTVDLAALSWPVAVAAALGAVALVLLLAWAAYVITGSYVLRTVLPRHVPGLALRGRTLLPGRVRVRAFRLDGDGWSLTARRARVRLPLFASLRTSPGAPLVFDRLDADGVTFTLYTDTAEATGGAEASGGAEGSTSPDLHIREFAAALEEVKLGAWRLRVPGRLEGGPLELSGNGGGLLGATRFAGGPGDVERRGTVIARVMRADVRVSARELDRSAFEVDVDVEAELPGLDVFNSYLARTPWIALEEGPGPIEAELVVRDGALAPGTRAFFSSPRAGARILDWHALGPGEMTFVVENDGRAGLRLALGAYELTRTAHDRPDLRGTGLVLTASSRGVTLGAPLEDASFRLDIPRGEIPDITVLNDFLGSGSPFSFVGGRALWEGHIDMPAGGGDASGTVRFEGEAVELWLANLCLMADLALDGRLRAGNLAERRFGLAGTSLAIRNLALVRAGRETGRQSGWHADVILPRGSITLSTPATLEARIDLALRDSGPILALFTPRRGLPGWLEQLLLIHGVAAIAELEVSAGRIRLTELAVQGGPVRLEARLTLAPDGSSGDLLARFGALSAGLELRDGELKIRRLRHATRWFDERG